MDSRVMDRKGRKCFKREWMINHLSQMIPSQINEGRELITGLAKWKSLVTLTGECWWTFTSCVNKCMAVVTYVQASD